MVPARLMVAQYCDDLLVFYFLPFEAGALCVAQASLVLAT